jgi:DNA polymerase-3 subunit delta
MVAIKPAEADAFVARPNPAQPIVLIYGADAGLVRERAEKIARSAVKDPDDPFAMVHIEGDALASDPSRLVEEAHTIPLFGGKRAVWVKPTSRNISSAVEALIASPPVDCRVVIEAGDLRRTSPIRTMCEKSKAAAAIACYVDTERDLARLVDDEMREAKLAITPDAKAAVVALIGGDRRASRGEIRKLALYAHGKDKVDIDDVAAVVADASGLALDDVIDAAFAGKIADAEMNFAKALADGTSPGTIMFAALRQVMQLHKARLALDAGGSTDEALRVFIPPVHFRRRPLVETALRNWNSARLGRLMEQLAEAALNVRRSPGLSDALAHRALLSIAMAARRREQ